MNKKILIIGGVVLAGVLLFSGKTAQQDPAGYGIQGGEGGFTIGLGTPFYQTSGEGIPADQVARNYFFEAPSLPEFTPTITAPSSSGGSSSSKKEINTYNPGTGVYIDTKGQGSSTAFPPSGAISTDTGFPLNSYDKASGTYTDARGQGYSTAFPPASATSTTEKKTMTKAELGRKYFGGGK